MVAKVVTFTAIYDFAGKRILLRPTQNNRKLSEGEHMGYLTADVSTVGFKWSPRKKGDAASVWSTSVKFKTASGPVSTYFTSVSEKYEYPLDLNFGFKRIPADFDEVASSSLQSFLETLDTLGSAESKETAERILQVAIQMLTIFTGEDGETNPTPGGPMDDAPCPWKGQKDSTCAYIGCCEASAKMLVAEDSDCHPCALCRMTSTKRGSVDFDVSESAVSFACIPCTKVMTVLIFIS